jgi:acyl-CoA thioesterase FadM
MRDKADYNFVLRNIRAQYKVPNSAKDLPTMKEWLKRMGATQFMIRRLEEAYEATKTDM